MPGNSDPYKYPATDVLRNLPDIHDQHRLADFEANVTVARLVELDVAPLKGSFDVPHLKAIHHYIFQDVYSWAGEFRSVNISKGGALFAAAAFVEPAIKAILWKLIPDRLEPDKPGRNDRGIAPELRDGSEFRNGGADPGFPELIGLLLSAVNALHSEIVLASVRPSFGFRLYRILLS